MAHYGTLRDYRFTGDVDDVRGASLYGADDEKLGKIDDVIFDHATGAVQYVVIDGGGWFNSKKFLLSADRIRPDSKHDDDFCTHLTKHQIENLPVYDEDKFSHDAKENQRTWTDYNERYRKSLETTGDVLHREASTHAITPGPDELPATGEPLPNEDQLEPERLAGVFPDPTPNPAKTRQRPSGIAARAEDSAIPGEAFSEEIPTRLETEALNRGKSAGANRPLASSRRLEVNEAASDPEQMYAARRHTRLADFEDQLRRNRVDITASCRSCAVKEDKVA